MRFPGPVSCEGQTPSQHFAPLNGFTTDAGGYTYYQRAGTIMPTVPTPFYTGNSWHFYIFGSGGSPDRCGNCVTNSIQWLLTGDGVLTVPTAPGPSSRNAVLQIEVWHKEMGLAAVRDYLSPPAPAGETFVAPVSSHGHKVCLHRVKLYEFSADCGGTMVKYSGADWTATESAEDDAESFAMRGSAVVG